MTLANLSLIESALKKFINDTEDDGSEEVADMLIEYRGALAEVQVCLYPDDHE